MRKTNWDCTLHWVSAGAVALFFMILGPSFFDFVNPGDERFLQKTFSQESLITDRKSLMRGDAFRSLMLVVFSAGTDLDVLVRQDWAQYFIKRFCESWCCSICGRRAAGI
jgi:hypothetical protein